MHKVNKSLMKKTIIVAIVLNIVLPFFLSPLATQDEVKPPAGAVNLSFKGQFMHMMVHHKQVALTSSFIVGLIVFLSICIASYM